MCVKDKKNKRVSFDRFDLTHIYTRHERMVIIVPKPLFKNYRAQRLSDALIAIRTPRAATVFCDFSSPVPINFRFEVLYGILLRWKNCENRELIVSYRTFIIARSVSWAMRWSRSAAEPMRWFGFTDPLRRHGLRFQLSGYLSTSWFEVLYGILALKKLRKPRWLLSIELFLWAIPLDTKSEILFSENKILQERCYVVSELKTQFCSESFPLLK